MEHKNNIKKQADGSIHIITPKSEEDIIIRELIPDINIYQDKINVICGTSGTGKTHLFKDIYTILRKHIPRYHVVCSTTSLPQYTAEGGEDISMFRREEIIFDMTSAKMTEIFETQKEMKKIYNSVHNYDNLVNLLTYVRKTSDLFKIFDRDIRIKIDTELNLIKEEQRELDRLYSAGDEASTILYQDNKPKHRHKYTLSIVELLMKPEIRKPLLSAMQSLLRANCAIQSRKKEQGQKIDPDWGNEHILLLNRYRLIIANLDINPRVCLIFDDRTPELKDWVKNKFSDTNKRNQEIGNPFSTLFFEGRHYFITTFLLIHDYKSLPPELRNNIKNIYFTAFPSMDRYLADQKTSKFVSKQSKAITEIFNMDNKDGKKAHCKIMIDPETGNLFYHIGHPNALLLANDLKKRTKNKTADNYIASLKRRPEREKKESTNLF